MGDMSPAEMDSVLEEHFECEATGDLEGLMMLVTDDAEHIVGVVDGAEDPVPAYASLLTIEGVAVEGPFPGVEIRDGVFDAKDRHGSLLTTS
jgi:hypothetical protein